MSQNKDTVFFSKFVLIALLLTALVMANSFLWPEENVQKVLIQTQDGNEHVFEVEVARTPEARKKGLMFREYLDEDKGMLFLYNKPETLNMWMKNTGIPLDMVFISGDGKIQKIEEKTVPYSLETISSDYKVSAVLEINSGLSEMYNIQKGDTVLFEVD